MIVKGIDLRVGVETTDTHTQRRRQMAWAATASSVSLELLENATVSLITERRTSPWGLEGGEPGAPGENWLLPAGDESPAERLPDKSTLRLRQVMS